MGVNTIIVMVISYIYTALLKTWQRGLLHKLNDQNYVDASTFHPFVVGEYVILSFTVGINVLSTRFWNLAAGICSHSDTRALLRSNFGWSGPAHSLFQGSVRLFPTTTVKLRLYYYFYYFYCVDNMLSESWKLTIVQKIIK